MYVQVQGKYIVYGREERYYSVDDLYVQDYSDSDSDDEDDDEAAVSRSDRSRIAFLEDFYERVVLVPAAICIHVRSGCGGGDYTLYSILTLRLGI